MVKVIAWYDNEWGYSCRVADLIAFVAARLPVARLIAAAPRWTSSRSATSTSPASASSSASTSTSRSQDGKVTDDSRIRAAHPDHPAPPGAGRASVILASHLGRPGRQGPGRPPPAPGRRAPEPAPAARTCRSPATRSGSGTEDAVKRLRAGRGAAAREPPLPRRGGEERPGVRRRRSPPTPTSTSTTPSGPPIAPTPRPSGIAEAPAGLRRAAHGARDRDALEAPRAPGAPVRGDPRRRQGLGQDQGPRAPARPRSTCSSSAAGWPTRSCSPRARPSARASPSPTASRTPARILRRRRGKGVRVVLPVDVVVAKEVTRGTEYKTLPAEKIPASLAHRRPRQGRAWTLIDEALGRRPDRLLERAAGRVRDPVVRPRHARPIARFLAERAGRRRDGRGRRRRLGRGGRPSRAWPTR